MSSETAARRALMTSLRLGRKIADRETPPPLPLEVWRASWDEVAAAVLITAVTDTGGVRVVPVTFDGQADHTAVVANPETNDLAIRMNLWLDDEGVIPARVLECRLASTTATDLAALPPGSTNTGVTDHRTRVRAELGDALDFFRGARWSSLEVPGRPLSDLFAKTDMSAVVEIAGSVAAAGRLRRGDLLPTREQAEALGALLDVPVSDILAARQPLPPPLVAVMDQPHVRSLVDQLAEQRGEGEAVVREAAAYAVLGLAARQHSRADSAWEARVMAYFESVLRLPDEDGR